MSDKILCRLCLTDDSSEYVHLYGNNGEPNDIHEIMVHYFHPEMLKTECGELYKDLCSECWSHILDFHNFQMAIVETQNNFHKDGLNYTVEEIIVEEHEENDDGALEKSYLELVEKETSDTSLIEDRDYIEIDGIIADEHVIRDQIVYPKEIPLHKDTNEDIDVVVCSDEEITKEIKAFQTFDEAKETQEIAYPPASKRSSLLQGNESADDSVGEPPNRKKLKCSQTNSSDGGNSQDYQPKFPPMAREKTNAEKNKESDDIIAQWLPTLECLLCHNSFPSFTALKQHHRKKHAKGEFAVVCCERKYTYRCQIEEHVRLHLDPNAFKCMLCGKRFSSRANFCSHKQSQCIPTYDEENKIKSKRESDKKIAEWRSTLECHECSDSFSTFTSLKAHFVQQHPQNEFYIACCGRKFYYRSNLERHVLLHIDSEYFKCDLCGKVLASKTSLKIHKKNHWKTAKTCSSNEEEMSKRKSFKRLDDIIAQWRPVLECLVCKHQCKSFTLLSEHFAEEHKESELYIECCGRKLGDRSKAMMHASRHLNPDSFACEVCGQSYTRRFKLRNHMRMAHPQFETVLFDESTNT
ncbi:oocyte zinc finger protein XlCOF6 isoform X1 [Stomoxys calcitrans]|uniref:oocyte zinc finger protein XlCOF6 isoform X1 n=1 Tax=Stomoxys calcitrans TaxID=35570 RepID=UPI0027E35B4E|nr:oocyte zinc finger protein XlCOF6 isoform X1 [Stomoxys calcitrans]